MKKAIIFLITIISGYFLQAQNTVVDPKGTPTSNKDLPSNNPALGSNSGVNPAGSPGTMTGTSGNSNSINNQTSPNPNIEPGVFLSSSPGGTVYSNPVPAGSNVQTSTTAVSANGGTVTVNETKPKPIESVAVEGPKVPAPNPPVSANTSLPPAAPIASSGMIAKNATTPAPKSKIKNTKPAAAEIVKEKNIPAYSPLLSNYIPEEVINKIKNKYGPSVYDIKTVRLVKENKLAYLVRLSENGNFKSEIYYDQP